MAKASGGFATATAKAKGGLTTATARFSGGLTISAAKASGGLTILPGNWAHSRNGPWWGKPPMVELSENDGAGPSGAGETAWQPTATGTNTRAANTLSISHLPERVLGKTVADDVHAVVLTYQGVRAGVI